MPRKPAAKKRKMKQRRDEQEMMAALTVHEFGIGTCVFHKLSASCWNRRTQRPVGIPESNPVRTMTTPFCGET